MVRTIPAMLALALTIAGGALGGHCTEPSSSPHVAFVAGYYVVNDPCQPGCLFSIWIIEETNGHPGLQRSTEYHDDTCHGMIMPDGDTIIF